MINQKIEIASGNQKRQLAYTESGNPLSQNIIFCIPGILETKDTFEPLHECAIRCTDVHIVSIDICGRGQSSPLGHGENYRMSVYLKDIQFLISEIIHAKDTKNSNPINIYLVGTSMGGILTLYLHQGLGNQIKGICLNDIGLTLKWLSIFELSKPISNSKVSLQELAERLKVSPEVLTDVQRNEHFDLPYKSDLIGMHFYPLLDHFNGTLLLIYGGHSVICTSDVVLEIKLRFPKSHQLKINDSKHPVTLNQEISKEILKKFKLIESSNI